MIVAQAQTVRSLLAEVLAAQRATSEEESIGETLAKLRTLKESLESIRARHLRVRDRLEYDVNHQFEQAFSQLIEDVRASRADFEQRSRQAQRLQQIISRAEQLNGNVDHSWSSYANDEVRPYAELMVLIQVLPEMRARGVALRRLRDRLQELVGRAPRTDDELREFDEKFGEFRTDLESVEGLTPMVREFLQRAVQGTATIADLSDEVLNWCRSADRERSFNIRLTSERW